MFDLKNCRKYRKIKGCSSFQIFVSYENNMMLRLKVGSNVTIRSISWCQNIGKE